MMATQLLNSTLEEEPSSSTSYETRSDESGPLTNCVPPKESYFEKEFIKKEELGKGGFGRVYKVENKTDHQEYAVKIVDNDNDNDYAVKEVKNLSRLRHVNVVRYYAAWKENWVRTDGDYENDACNGNGENRRSSLVPDSTKQILVPRLYIQMELCHTSLRFVIDNKNHNKEQLIHYLHGIVLGLEYVHNKGLIHRDLNPNNIFIGYDDKIKIGDFGLARCGEGECQAFSPNVGTLLYQAPEVHTETYDKTVDTYSLGIIMFEMVYPMNTGMERQKVLDALRTSLEFPGDFLLHALPWQKAILESILNHCPEKRLSLANILNQMLDECPYLTEVNHDRVIKVIFKGKESDRSVRFGNLESPKIIRPQWDILTSIESIFRKFGASHFQAPLLTPRSSLKEDPSVVELATRSGLIVRLPLNSRINFSRHLILNSIGCMKRFDSPQSYEDTNLHQYHPKVKYECVFDIVTSDPDIVEVDAQLLDVLIAVYDFVENMCHRDKGILTEISINHVDIIKIILRSVGVSHEELNDVLLSIGTKGYEHGLSSLEPHLIEKIDMNKLNWILSLSGSDLENSLLQEVDEKDKRVIQMAFEHLRNVMDYLKHTINNWHPVTVNINRCSNVHQYSGILFSFGSSEEVIADGGRYDEILHSLSSELENNQSRKRFGCGLTVYPSNIAKIVEDVWPPELIVLTCQKNFKLEKLIFYLASLLRRFGYNCDTKLNMTPAEIEAHKKDPEVLCLIENLPSSEFDVTHKFSKIGPNNDFLLLNDYNPNPPTMRLSLNSFKASLVYMFLGTLQEDIQANIVADLNMFLSNLHEEILVDLVQDLRAIEV